jgi:large exoprotein involved in heme utilization and adhesion
VGNVPINGELPAGNGAVMVNGGKWDVSRWGEGGEVWISGGAVSITNGVGIYNHNTYIDNKGISIKANTLLISDSSISNLTHASGNAGNVAISVQGDMQILNGGSISSSTWGSGNAGTITVTAGSLTIDGQGGSQHLTGIYTSTDSTGYGGVIAINVAEAMQMLNEGRISISGNAGTITVNAGNLTIDGQGSQHLTGIRSSDAGIVNINIAEDMQILNGGNISSSTKGSGNAGTITVNAGNLTIDGQGSQNLTGIWSYTGSTGDASIVNINVAGAMQVLNGGGITTFTNGIGNAGSITITAESLSIYGATTTGPFTGIDSLGSNVSTGHVGNITINVSGEIQILYFTTP